TSSAKVQRRSSAELKVRCAPRNSRSTMGHRSEGSVIAQNVTVCGRVKGTIRAVRVKLQNGGRSRVTFFIGRCRSTRTLSLKDRRGELRIQRSHRRASTPKAPRKARRKKTCPRRRYRPSTPS